MSSKIENIFSTSDGHIDALSCTLTKAPSGAARAVGRISSLEAQEDLLLYYHSDFFFVGRYFALCSNAWAHCGKW